jgi:hypothetical protein
LEIQLHSLQSQRVTDEMLSIEPGIPYAFPRKKLSRLRNDIQNSKHFSE